MTAAVALACAFKRAFDPRDPWNVGYDTGWRDAQRMREAEAWSGTGADRRRADVVGELAWPMEGSDRPEWH